jgi:hypothetical protein
MTLGLDSTQLSMDRFVSALDSAFEIKAMETDGASLEIRLIEVKRRPAPPGYEQFSALFIGPASPVYPQGIYRFAHPAMGTLDLFMVPVGRAAAGIQYEVCVSRETADGASASA